MFTQQLYTKCLAQAAYFIESDGEAIVIDPIREIQPYLDLAEARDAKIKYIFETHFHADFVSGHLDLQKATGAPIIYGPGAKTTYPIQITQEGETFKIGKLTLKTLHTPGHTPESISLLLFDEDGKEHALFSGDTLFVGDVGRPDLVVESELTSQDLAGMMYDSLHNKILPLSDDVIIYPAHGAGSACGKNISSETSCNLGKQRKNNYALQPMDRKDFIEMLSGNLYAPPRYFAEDRFINQKGYETLENVLKKNTKKLSLEELKKLANNQNILLDTRIPNEFEKGFLKNSISVGLNGQYAIWVGSLFDIDKPIVIIAQNEESAEKSIVRLARVGYENVLGYIIYDEKTFANAGFEIDKLESFTPEEALKAAVEKGNKFLDVRRPGEFETAHVKNALSFPLKELEEDLKDLDKNTHYNVHCKGGYRSVIASSILKANGFKKLSNVYGGFDKMEKTEGYELEEK